MFYFVLVFDLHTAFIASAQSWVGLSSTKNCPHQISCSSQMKRPPCPVCPPRTICMGVGCPEGNYVVTGLSTHAKSLGQCWWACLEFQVCWLQRTWISLLVMPFKSLQLAYSNISSDYPLNSSSFQSPHIPIHTRVIILHTHTQPSLFAHYALSTVVWD